MTTLELLAWAAVVIAGIVYIIWMQAQRLADVARVEHRLIQAVERERRLQREHEGLVDRVADYFEGRESEAQFLAFAQALSEARSARHRAQA